MIRGTGPSRKMMTPESPYWIPGLGSDQELGNPTLRNCVMSRSPFAPAAEQLTLSMAIRTNVTIFFRTLLYFGHFFDCYSIYWDAVSEAMGWAVDDCRTISKYYIRGRLEYIEQNNSFTLPSSENRASNLICRLIDDYRVITRNNGRARSHAVLTQARKDYIDQTRLTWGRILREQTAELMETPYSPLLPIIPEVNDWLSPQATSARTRRRRSRSRSPTPATRRDDRTRSPLRPTPSTASTLGQRGVQQPTHQASGAPRSEFPPARRSTEMDVLSRWRETTPADDAEPSQGSHSLNRQSQKPRIEAGILQSVASQPPRHSAATSQTSRSSIEDRPDKTLQRPESRGQAVQAFVSRLQLLHGSGVPTPPNPAGKQLDQRPVMNLDVPPLCPVSNSQQSRGHTVPVRSPKFQSEVPPGMGRHDLSAMSLGQGSLAKNLAQHSTPIVRPEPKVKSKSSPSPDLEFISENPVIKAKEKTTMSSSPELVPTAQVDAHDVEMTGERIDQRETQGRDGVNPDVHPSAATPRNLQQGRNTHHTGNPDPGECVAQMMATTIAELEEMASRSGIVPSARETYMEILVLQRIALRTLQGVGKQN